MLNSLRKGLVELLVTAMTLLPSGCKKAEAPRPEDFNNQTAVANIPGVSGESYLVDTDEDGQVDGILTRDPTGADTKMLYIVKGYEDKIRGASQINYTREMSPEIRQRANNVFHSINDLGFEIARQRYEEDNK